MLIGQRPKRVHNLTRDFIIECLEDQSDQVCYVQVGANDGVLDDPIHKISEKFGWKALLIEPNSSYFARLSELYADRPDIMLENSGVSEKSGTLELFALSPEAESKYPDWARGCASVDRERLERVLSTQADVDDADIVAEKIPVKPLSKILSAHKIKKADLLVIDVEGHELPVLKSANLDRLKPKLLIVEANSGSDAEIREVISAAGYAIHRIGDDLIAFSDEFAPVPATKLMDLIGFPEITE